MSSTIYKDGSNYVIDELGRSPEDFTTVTTEKPFDFLNKVCLEMGELILLSAN